MKRIIVFTFKSIYQELCVFLIMTTLFNSVTDLHQYEMNNQICNKQSVSSILSYNIVPEENMAINIYFVIICHILEMVVLEPLLF